MATCLCSARCEAQLGRTIPGPTYYEAVEEIYRGEYINATRGLRNELRGAVRTTQSRWIDSICYHSMLGEALYHQGLTEAALEQFDRALELFESQAAWLLSVNFQQQPRPNPNRARRLPDWARPSQPVTFGDAPDTQLVTIGRIDNSAAANQGGVVQQAQYWRIDAQEVVRSVAWAIYRRGQILGPLANLDPLQSRLVELTGRGSLGPARHWSGAWTELWLGAALASQKSAKQAAPHLVRATLLNGQSAHRLSTLALLMRGSLALEARDASAGPLLNDAIVAAIAYQDAGALDEALRLLHLYQTATGSKEPHPLIDPVSVLAARERLSHIAARGALAISESLFSNNQTDQAIRRMDRVFGRRREMQNGLLGVEASRLNAIGLTLQGDASAAVDAYQQALPRQMEISHRGLRVRMANAWFDSGLLSPRLAPETYQRLLGEPSADDWLHDPMDVIVSLGVDQSGALERWFGAEFSRNNANGAFEAAEAAKRRRYYSQQPLSGRVVGLRRLLESSRETLSADEKQLASSLAESQPMYELARNEARKIRETLADDPQRFHDGSMFNEKRAIEALRESLRTREGLLVAMALSRTPTPMSYPPPLDLEQARARLAPGEALIQFHQTSREYFGMLLVAEGEDLWAVGKSGQIDQQVAEWLRMATGGGPKKVWSPEELADSQWQDLSRALGERLFSRSRIDFPRVEKITVIPDGALWRLPFEAIAPVASDVSEASLLDLAPVRYAPTVALATRLRAPPRPVRRTAWAPPAGMNNEKSDPLQSALEDSLLLDVSFGDGRAVIKALSDRLVISEMRKLDPEEPLSTKLWGQRREGEVSLAAWAGLPFQGPQQLVIDAIEANNANPRRSANRSNSAFRPGDEFFHAVCALMAPGTSSALLTRWTTGGARHQELVAEYLTGAGQMDAAEAWRRSVRLARPMTLKSNREPRLESMEESTAPAPDASHPFYWAGYLLLE